MTTNSEITTAELNARGEEINNPEPTVHYTPINKPPTLQEQIQRLMRNEVSQSAHNQGFETFEESQDFETDEDPEPINPYGVEEIPMTDEFPANEVPSSEPGSPLKTPSVEDVPEPAEKGVENQPETEPKNTK